MKLIYFFILFFLFPFSVFSQSYYDSLALNDSKMRFYLNINPTGKIEYHIIHEQDTIISPSKLGMVIDGEQWSDGFEMITSKNSITDSIRHLPWGANKQICEKHIEKNYHLIHHPSKRHITLSVRAYAETIAFRYIITDTFSLTLNHELTETRIAGMPTVWWCWADFNTYEKEYYQTSLDSAAWTALPLVMRYPNGKHLAIREAATLNYPDATLKNEGNGNFHWYLTPYKNGEKAHLEAPFATPWRVFTITADAPKLLNNNDLLSLVPPSTAQAYAGKPMTYIGIWWNYHLGTQSWEEGKRHGATTRRTKQYIRFAAKHNIGGVLVEGWNKGWGDWGNAHTFLYTQPTNDYNLEKVARFAQKKGVRLIMHHETGGDIIGYEAAMEEAFRQCQALGIHDVKTGHAGAISTGENHHGQQVVSHFQRVIETAAQYQIALDMHEPVNGSGLEIAYPNFMTREGVRGLEWDAWSHGNSPTHTNTLPYTRGLSGPMDYTPGIFDLLFKNAKNRVAWNCSDSTLKATRIHTSLAHQLALMVTLYSPWVMAADDIRNYKNHPMFNFVEQLNPDYDESHVLQGEIGEYIVVARRSGKTWYIAATTNEKMRTLTIPLNFLSPKLHYCATLYKDNPNKNWHTDKTKYIIEKQNVTQNSTLNITLPECGGVAIIISEKQK